jgi:hypothetical protein
MAYHSASAGAEAIGNDWGTLYFTSRNHLGAVNVKIPDVSVPTRKK